MPLLEIEQLSVAFRRQTDWLRQEQVEVLREVSLSVEAGTLHAVIGASGAGKSLLLHAILGLLPGQALCTGEIRFAGERLDEVRLQRLRGTELMYMPQSISALDPLMKAGQQVRLSGRRPLISEAVLALLAQYGLGHEAAERYPFELSGGMARRVLLAMATARTPRLLLVDEPTPGLHEEASASALAAFRRLANAGCAVVMITHDLREAAAAADQVSVMHAGCVVDTVAAGQFRAAGEGLAHPYTRALWQALPEQRFSAHGDGSAEAPVEAIGEAVGNIR